MFSKELLQFFICAKMTPGNVLIVGKDSEALAGEIKAFVGDYKVMAIPSISAKSADPGAPTNIGTSIDLVQGQLTTKKKQLDGSFRYIVCWGPLTTPHASGLSRSPLPSLLRLWRTYLKSEGRIILRMYAAEDEQVGDWRAMESRYRHTAKMSNAIVTVGGVDLDEINGLYSDDEFTTARASVGELVRSIEGIATRVQEVDPVNGGTHASWLRQRAEKIGVWKGSRDLTEAEKDRLVRANSRNEVFYATFRPW